jgi:hypothetical protein
MSIDEVLNVALEAPAVVTSSGGRSLRRPEDETEVHA